jgi:hypothetical protein
MSDATYRTIVALAWRAVYVLLAFACWRVALALGFECVSAGYPAQRAFEHAQPSTFAWMMACVVAVWWLPPKERR